MINHNPQFTTTTYTYGASPWGPWSTANRVNTVSPPKDHRAKFYLEQMTSVTADPLTKQEVQELVVGLLRYAEQREDMDRRMRRYYTHEPNQPEETPHV